MAPRWNQPDRNPLRGGPSTWAARYSNNIGGFCATTSAAVTTASRGLATAWNPLSHTRWLSWGAERATKMWSAAGVGFTEEPSAPQGRGARLAAFDRRGTRKLLPWNPKRPRPALALAWSGAGPVVYAGRIVHERSDGPGAQIASPTHQSSVTRGHATRPPGIPNGEIDRADDAGARHHGLRGRKLTTHGRASRSETSAPLGDRDGHAPELKTPTPNGPPSSRSPDPTARSFRPGRRVSTRNRRARGGTVLRRALSKNTRRAGATPGGNPSPQRGRSQI